MMVPLLQHANMRREKQRDERLQEKVHLNMQLAKIKVDSMHRDLVEHKTILTVRQT